MCVSLEQSHWVLWHIIASGFTHFYYIICYFHWHFQVYALGAGEHENHLLNMLCVINVNAELLFKKIRWISFFIFIQL